MRWGLHLVLGLSLLFGGDAFAARGDRATAPHAVEASAAGQQKGGANKNNKNKNNKNNKNKKGKKSSVQVTGIKSFDRVFKEVGEIDGRLAHAENQLRTGRTNLNAALGLSKSTSFADALQDLQNKAGGNLRLATSGKIPKLEATDAVPTNVQSALDGFNGFTENFTNTITDVKDVSKDISRLVDATAQMPNNLVREFSKGSDGTVGLIEKLFVLPKAIKATSNNIKIVTGLDDRVTGLSSRMTDLVDVVNTSFKPMPGQGGKKGGNGGGNGGKKKKGNGGGR